MRRRVKTWLITATVSVTSIANTAPPVAHFKWMYYIEKDPVEDAFPIKKDEYRNPITPGFQPDPSIVCVGKDFYLVNSTFAFYPDIPVYHSRDLVHWRQIGNVIDRPGQVDITASRLLRYRY
jgi:xylan 1,4-beta-xylosidase